MDRKTLHEQFVTGFTGGSISDIYVVAITCVASMLTYHYVSKCVQTSSASFTADFLFNWVCVLAATTIYADHLWILLLFLISTAFVAYKNSPVPPPSTKQSKQQKRKVSVDVQIPYRPFLTAYRSAMMVLTVTSILAVDFRIFPRRFAKTETWGTSLMDLGVGSFVFSMGVISVRRRLKNPTISFRTEVKESIIQTAKVLALGFVRLAAVKNLDYQEHVSEYGVHWNFFFTLGCLPLAFTLISRIPFPKAVFGRAAALSLLYELALKNTGLLEWALSAPRTDLISQNKEGLVSFLGYLCIFQFGYSLGEIILDPGSSYIAIIQRSAKWSLGAHILYFILSIATQTSRRLANLPYIIWICAFNTGFISLLAGLENYFGMMPSNSYVSVNSYGETVFLLANILTGLINLSLDTLSMSRTAALAVLSLYQLVTMLASQYLYGRSRRPTRRSA